MQGDPREFHHGGGAGGAYDITLSHRVSETIQFDRVYAVYLIYDTYKGMCGYEIAMVFVSRSCRAFPEYAEGVKGRRRQQRGKNIVITTMMMILLY